MFERILVPLDGGPRGDLALEVAERMAAAWGARLDVLGLAQSTGTLPAAEEAVVRQTAELQGRGTVSVKMAVTSVTDEIVDAIETTPSTLVVMATSAKNRSAAFSESIADAVLRSIDGPALLIGPHAEVPPDWPAGALYICTDGSDLSEAIIPHAAAVADRLALEPWFITVADPSDIPATVPAAMESNYTARLAMDFQPLVGREVNFDVLHGPHPADRIVDHTRDHGAAMIAMATHGHSGLRRLTMGSVAMAVAHDATCPVLVSRPED